MPSYKPDKKLAGVVAALTQAGFSRAALNACLLPGTAFYDSIQTYYNGWYNDHSSFAYRDLCREALQLWSGEAFSAQLSFNYVIRMRAKEYMYPSCYALCFVRADGAWKVASLAVQQGLFCRKAKK